MSVDKIAAPKKGGRTGRGRPPANVSLKRAIRRLEIDPADVDPLKILAAIACNTEAPSTARVAAARALLDNRPPPAPPPPKDDGFKLEWLGGLDDE
jgi:hypothetical protein